MLNGRYSIDFFTRMMVVKFPSSGLNDDNIDVEYQANATGRNSKTVREFLEKNYQEDMSDDDAIKLAIKALLEVSEPFLE